MSTSARKSPPLLGITTGDPAGIGPEVSLRAAFEPGLRNRCRLLLFGDAHILRERTRELGLASDLPTLSSKALGQNKDVPELAIFDVPAAEGIVPGVGSAATGEAAGRNIVACAGACLSGRVQAMVTAPLNKKFLNEAGYLYPGHTEFLADLAETPAVAMAFLSDPLKVVLVTIHLPLRLAIDSITTESVFEKLELAIREFPRLGLPCRRIAVAGLNPHAGESGLLGMEEIERIEPAIWRARENHPDVRIDGPIPADTLFYRASQGEFDLVLALYHDQGLAPIKLLAFGRAVNVTLGLPFVRTSVDHGTAYDIASRGTARPEGMISAIEWALRLIR